MRVLVVSLFCPLPANNGVKMRTWSVLRALAAQGHQVHLLCPAEEASPENEAMLAAICNRVKLVPVPRALHGTFWKQAGRAASLLSPWPSSVARARSRSFRDGIRACLAHMAIDLIVFEQSIPVINLPAELRVPFIVDFHNIDHIIYQRYAVHAPHAILRSCSLLEMAKFAGWEMRVARRAAAAWVCSEADANLLGPLAPTLPIFIAPNVLDVDSYVPIKGGPSFTLLFQGGMDWYPNQDAVEFFITSVFPRVRQAIPQAEFIVAGKNPPERLRRRWASAQGVSFTGAFADLPTLLGSAAVSVVPLRIGSGTRLKILEAAAMGKAIVSTSVGAEGLRFVPGKEVLLADDPEEFAAAIVALLQNDFRRRRLGQAARCRVRKDYTLAAMQPAVRKSLSLIERAEPAPAREIAATGLPAENAAAMPAPIERGGVHPPLPYPAAKPPSSPSQ
jgi:glycosyltransferase involved in cell wall biosynthesis